MQLKIQNRQLCYTHELRGLAKREVKYDIAVLCFDKGVKGFHFTIPIPFISSQRMSQWPYYVWLLPLNGLGIIFT